MDITVTGAYLNTIQQTPLSGRSAPERTDTVFADLLDAHRNARTGESAGSGAAGETGQGPALSGRKPVIDKTGKLYEQCEALETFLVKTLIKGMRDTVQKTNLIDTGFAGQMYEDMLYDEYAKDFTRNANFGLAELAYLELTGQRGKIPSGAADSSQ
jgi:flagellar protein FlgJ